MRAVWIPKHGRADVLEVRETPDPEPAAGEVRVQVRAAGLNFAEVSARQGLYPDAPKPPCVVGYEGAGVVDRVGEGVESLAVGDRVLYLSRFWGHASAVCVPEGFASRISDQMSFEHAAALPVNYLTAWHMLHEVRRIRPGERVLVHAAAGGVGTAVLQLCRHVEGVTTFGTASAPKHDYAREQGCHHPIDYRTQDYVEEVMRLTDGEGVDLVLDARGGPDWRKGYSLLREAGMLVAFGLANAQPGGKRNLLHALKTLLQSPRFKPFDLLNENRAVAGVNLGTLWHRHDMLSAHLARLLEAYDAGRIEPHVDATFPFEEAAQAHRRIEQHQNRGKLLLIP